MSLKTAVMNLARKSPEFREALKAELKLANKTITVIPAYGRDYTSEVKIKADWDAGKDFMIQDVSSPYNGSYVNKADLLHSGSGVGTVKVRYGKGRKVFVFRLE